MRFWAGLAAVLAAAAMLLAAPRAVVRGPDGIRLLGDTDPHYHVLRAERLARHAPGAPWRDPALDWPNGADVPWPPLFDAVIAAAARITGAETRDGFALAGAYVVLVFGVLSVLLVGVVGRAIGGDALGLTAAAIAAALPALARYAVIGRVDQHVAEVLLASAIALAFLKGIVTPPARAAPFALGAAIAISFWMWMGSTVALLAPSAAIALAHLTGQAEIARRGGRTLAVGATTAAVLLALTVAAFGEPGALTGTSVTGIGGLHVATVVGLAAFAGVIAWRAKTASSGVRRALDVFFAASVPAGLLLALWPGLVSGVSRGLVALAAANPWYEDIREFHPALFGGIRSVRKELAAIVASFGAVPLLAALAIPASLRRWRENAAARPALFFVAVWAGVTLTLATTRTRFFPYFAVPCAIAAAAGALSLGAASATRLRRNSLGRVIAAAIVAASLLPAASSVAELAAGIDRVPERWIEATRWIRTLAPPPDGRAAVGAPWELGHLVQYYADRPVIGSPFGTEAGPRALLDWSRFLFTADVAEAEALLLSRQVSLLLLRNPSHELVGLRGYAPAGVTPPLVVTRDAWRGETVGMTARFLDLVVSRLYFGDGAGGADGSLDFARLVWEGASTEPDHPLHEERLKAFEVVPGAAVRVEGASPGAGVIASIDVVTNTGRTFTWSTRRIADRGGAVSLRVPYATGANAAVLAGGCILTDGSRSALAPIPAEAVETGGAVTVSLAGATARR